MNKNTSYNDFIWETIVTCDCGSNNVDCIDINVAESTYYCNDCGNREELNNF